MLNNITRLFQHTKPLSSDEADALVTRVQNDLRPRGYVLEECQCLSRQGKYSLRNFIDDSAVQMIQKLPLVDNTVSILSYGSGSLRQEATIALMLIARGYRVHFNFLDVAYGNLQIKNLQSSLRLLEESFWGIVHGASNRLPFHNRGELLGFDIVSNIHDVKNVDFVLAVDFTVSNHQLKQDIQKLVRLEKVDPKGPCLAVAGRHSELPAGCFLDGQIDQIEYLLSQVSTDVSHETMIKTLGG